HGDYNVVIICPLEVEVSAVRYMLDEEHARLLSKDGDSNRYLCGRMCGHNVVIAYLPQGSQGVGAAAVVATDVKRSFPHTALRLLIGIGGGVPSKANDIRLGDVVISMPTGQHGGVVQYDLGRETSNAFERKGILEPPPTDWRNCVVEMQSDHRIKDNQITAYVDKMIKKHPGLSEYSRPKEEKDILFRPSNKLVLNGSTCASYDRTEVVDRPPRDAPTPRIFYGLIASGNRVIKSAELRDRIANDAGGALCFEMEAAGLMNDFRCIVIRGISDYADSHKNDIWHAYAAAVAAGCAKELLSFMSQEAQQLPQTTKST
ncbi:purine and uridine phosphorylase, partial [Polychaeton citri CBS 116435]